MPLYEVEVKVRVCVQASDREQAKQHAAAIASRIPITGFEMTARRSLMDVERLPKYDSRNEPIGK